MHCSILDRRYKYRKQRLGDMRKLYNWTLSQAEKENAIWVLAFVSFIESSVFPIPPDVLLIPMILARPNRAFWFAGVCTVASVLGGLAGYMIGYFAFDLLGKPVLELYGYSEKFLEFQSTYNDWGAWAVLIAGVTPFPFKVITVLSGATSLNVGVFMAASLIARALRFFLLAGLLWWFGERIRALIERHFGLMMTAIAILTIGGFVMIKYVL